MKVPGVFPDSFRKLYKKLISNQGATNQEIVLGGTTATTGGPEDDEGEGPDIQAQLEVQSQHVAQLQAGRQENPRHYSVSLSPQSSVNKCQIICPSYCLG